MLDDMEWFRVESVFPESEKVEKLERFHARLFEKAITMWLFAGCHCAKNSTDGRISRYRMERLVPTIKRPRLVVEALIECGLIDILPDAPDDVTMHDYLDYNPSKVEREKWREDNRRRQADFRERRRNALPEQGSNGVSNPLVTTPRNNPPVLSSPVLSNPGCESAPAHEEQEQYQNQFDIGHLDEIYDQESRAAGKGPYRPKHADYRKREDAHVDVLAIAQDNNRDPVIVARQSIKNFFADKDGWLVEHGYPIGSWVGKVAHYYRGGAKQEPESIIRQSQRERGVDVSQILKSVDDA